MPEVGESLPPRDAETCGPCLASRAEWGGLACWPAAAILWGAAAGPTGVLHPALLIIPACARGESAAPGLPLKTGVGDLDLGLAVERCSGGCCPVARTVLV